MEEKTTDMESSPQETAGPAIPPANENSPGPIKEPGKKKSRAVIMAVLVVIVLAALAAYAFTKDKTPADSTSTTATNQQATEGTVQSSDLVQTAQDLDNTIKDADDANDINSSDLSDNTLGL